MEKTVTVNGLEIVLTNPVKFGEETIDKLVLREPVARDFRGMKSTEPFAMMLDLAAAVSGVSPSVIDQLSAADTMAVFDVVGGFLPSSQKNGAT